MNTSNFTFSLDILNDYNYLLGFSLLTLEFLYIIFAFLITRQIKLLNNSFNTPYESSFRFIANMHFIFSILVFIVSILLI